MTEPTLSERVAELERTLADVTRERDVWKEAHFDLNRDYLRQVANMDATAERRATEAAREAENMLVAHLRGLGYDVRGQVLADISAYLADKYPAVPPEREGAQAEYWCVMFGDNETTGDLFLWEHEAHAHARGLDAKHPDTAHVVVRLVAPSLQGVRPTPQQAAPEPRIAKPSAQIEVGQKIVQRWDSDGFGRTWYRVVQEGHPNRDYGEFRGLLHSLMSNPPMPTPVEYSALLSLAADCQRIVETGRRASGRDDA